MARKNLFDESGTRAGQADNKNRSAGRASLALHAVEKRAIELLYCALDASCYVVPAVRICASYKRIAATVIVERFGIARSVFKRLAEREMQIDPILRFQILTRQLCLHRFDLEWREAERLEIGQR